MRAAMKTLRLAPSLLAVLLACAYLPQGHAALFEDDEARRAILELRQRVDVLNQASQRSADDSAQLRRALIDLQSQIEGLRSEVASLRGQNEQLMREASEDRKSVV